MSLIEQSALSFLRFDKKVTSGIQNFSILPRRAHIEEKVDGIFPRYKEVETAHSDFYTRFLEYVENINTHGEAAASATATSQILNILRSVGQEAKGIGEMFQVATKVDINDAGKLIFSNPLYKKGEDIQAWWDYHILHDATNRRERIRFKRERDQLIVHLFPELSTPLLETQQLQPNRIPQHLLTHGFFAQKLYVSKGIHDVCPELSIGDAMTFLIGPHIGTVSPKSIVHNDARTSILWLSRLAYVPETESWLILQDGRFSTYSDTDLQVFLSLGKNETPPLGIFNREARLMETLALLRTEFAYQNPHAIFEHIEKLTRKSFGSKAAEGAEKQMTADLSYSAKYLLEVFRFEYQRCTENPTFIKGLKERIQEYAGSHVLHHLATDENLSIEDCLTLYKDTFFTEREATHPRRQRNKFNAGTLQFYPKFSIRVNLSLLDCGAGTILGAATRITSFGELQAALGNSGIRMLNNIDGRSISDREEFEKAARSFKKDPSRFKEWGKCRNPNCESGKKGLSNYLGECGVCLACEVKDDLGIQGSLADYMQDDLEKRKGEHDQIHPEQDNTGSSGIGTFISSIAHGGIANFVRYIDEYPEYFPS